MTDLAGTAKVRPEKIPTIKSETPNAAVVPMFGFPRFEMPNLGLPLPYPEFTQQGLAQARKTGSTAKVAAEAASAALADSFATIVKGSSDCGLKIIEAAYANFNAALDYAGALLAAKTLSDVIDVTTTRAQKQLEAFVSQTAELTARVQRVAIDAAEPVKAGLTKTFNDAA